VGEKIVVGPINHGLRNNVTAFNIDNDSFPTLLNAYQWRGRAKRKRGTSFLTRLQRYFNSTNISYNTGTTTITLNGSGVGNLLVNASWTLQADGNIVPGSVIITAPGPTVYTDPSMNGTLSPSGSINYATGVITIAAQAGAAVSVIFSYYPDLPVMGLRDFVLDSSQFPKTIDFDTVYSYTTINVEPFTTYDVSFYKNPDTDPITLPGYIPKTNVTPVTWNGQDYQQFWTVNYQGAMWATNGINLPFSTTNIGMQYKPITNVVIDSAGPPAIATLTIIAHGLVQGDFVFINEVEGITGINFQTGYVISADPQAANTVQVEFPNATLGGAYASGGIAQYLTNRSDPTKDCIRWYDGDPTDGNIVTPTLNGHKGWVNFCPPLSQSNFSISDLPADQYYLVGARVIIPFKDRLLFFGPVVQTSSAGSQVYLQDTVIYSQNGTPYYTVSYTNSPNPAIDTPTSSTNVFTPLLVPTNQTATAGAYFEDSAGFGGFLEAGIDQEIIGVSSNEDALIVGFTQTQTRLIYSGNDIIPFNFFLINSEFGTSATFSVINMDRGVLSTGSRGILLTSQTESVRIDLEIPDEVFQFRLTDNGIVRVAAHRDFINEWAYFTYPYGPINYRFPTQTLQYNYRDNSWGVFRETYTTYGNFYAQDGFTWQTISVHPDGFETWDTWNEPWNAGSSNLLQPKVIGGNQQGFVMVRDDGTGEGESLYIQSISGDVITCPDHCLSTGDFIVIKQCIGTNVGIINGHTFSIRVIDNDSFQIDPGPIYPVTYLGRGVIERVYVPLIQSKQFPAAWGMARKTRLGPQQYLLTFTQNSQITLLIYLSENGSSPYNDGAIVPAANVQNNSLVYSSVLYTCPESTNLGLSPANTNLIMPTAEQQAQIWHRVNTSLLGDTIQVGFTLSEAQLAASQFSDTLTITGATQANPLVLTCNNTLDAGHLIQISGVLGMTQLNSVDGLPHIYQILSRTDTHITIDVNSTAFGAYVSGGIATPVTYKNATAEIELHGFILDVNPSQVLA
jgi:hypothetical protein